MATIQIPVPLVVADSSGNGYPLLTAGTVQRHLTPAYKKDVVGDWFGIVRVPQDYVNTPKIILSIAANAVTGVSTIGLATAVLANGGSYNPGALTAETDQDISLPATAYQRTDVTFNLSTTPAAGSDLLVRARHNGTATNDTLAVDSILFEAVFQYANA